MLLTALLMLISFLLGKVAVDHLPTTHLDEFSEALNRGEVLLMVDVPVDQVRPVGMLLKHTHPEVRAGGACWLP